MPNIQCLLFEPTGRTQRSLRRFSRTWGCGRFGSVKAWHDARVPLDEIEETQPIVISDCWPHEDPRWPSTCACGYVFTEEDHWQVFAEPVRVCVATGQRVPHSEMPVGAMYFLVGDVWEGCRQGPDGKSLMVLTPGGPWMVDARASNCTMPDDNEHRCWVRHGDAPRITVDKLGNTCGAGAGSIQIGNYHGFLRDGILVEA